MIKDRILVAIVIVIIQAMISRVMAVNLDIQILGIGPLSLYLWMGLLIIRILMVRSAILTTRTMQYLYLFIIVTLIHSFYLNLLSMWWLERWVLPIALSVLLHEILMYYLSKETLRFILRFTLLFIAFSCVLNIIGLIRFPLAVRAIVGGGGGYAPEEVTYFTRIGISNYGFFSGLPYLLPVIYYLFRKSSGTLNKAMYLGLIMLMILTVYFSTITTPLLLGSIALLVSVYSGTMLRRGVAVIMTSTIVILMILFTPEGVIDRSLSFVGNIAPSEAVQRRVGDIQRALQEGIEVEAETESRGLTTVELRLQRIYWIIDGFLKRPLTGSPHDIPPEAYHLHWLYLLGSTGILGFGSLLLLFVEAFRNNLRMYKDEYRYFYSISLLTFITMGILKVITGWFMYLGIFIIVPLSYHLSREKPPVKDRVREISD
ncbi:MAG: hypothetical protein FJ042_04105 [Candidatus Cloacimonetes bacterium]|nr:hypothetical protein [Candidatus Cloacimonadota bacterium]